MMRTVVQYHCRIRITPPALVTHYCRIENLFPTFLMTLRMSRCLLKPPPSAKEPPLLLPLQAQNIREEQVQARILFHSLKLPTSSLPGGDPRLLRSFPRRVFTSRGLETRFSVSRVRPHRTSGNPPRTRGCGTAGDPRPATM